MSVIFQFINYIFASHTRYGIHSPFLFDFLDKGLKKSIPPEVKARVSQYRRDLLADSSYIEVKDMGAGSKVFKYNRRKVSRIARTAGTDQRKMRLLLKTFLYFKPATALELGTSLGMGSAIMSAAGIREITTVEACPETAAKAGYFLHKNAMNNVRIINGTFDEKLPALLDGNAYDICYIDGDHRYEPLMKYYTMISPHLHNDSICIVDDIRYSPGMWRAWNEIITGEEVTLSLDFFNTGMLFFKKELTKDHKSILFL